MVSRLQDDLVPGMPGGFLEFTAVHMDGGIPVHVTEKAGQQIIHNTPGLGFVIADVLDPDARLFHDLTPDCVFKSLADLSKTGDQRIMGKVPSRVFCQQDPVPVEHTDDNSRDNPGINDTAAFRTAECPLRIRMDCRMAAGPAETVVPVPVGQLIGSQS